MKRDIPEKDEILQVLQAHSPRAMHVGALCDRLDVSAAQRTRSSGAYCYLPTRTSSVKCPVCVFERSMARRTRSVAEKRSKAGEVAEGKRKKRNA